MLRTILAVTLVAVLASSATAQVVFNEDFTDGVVNSPVSIGWFHSGADYSPSPRIMTVDGVTMYGSSRAEHFGSWPATDFNVDLSGTAATLQTGYVWVVDLGMYSNYISSADSPYWARSAAVSFDTLSGPDYWPTQTEGIVMRHLADGAYNNAYCTDTITNEFYDSGLKDASEGTIYTVDAVALKGQIVNTSFMMRNTATGALEWAARQGNNQIQKTTSTSTSVGTINTMMVQIINQASYWPTDVLNLSTGTIANIDSFDNASLVAGVTGLKVQKVRTSDFNASGTTDQGDASVLLNNWQGTDRTFFQGDADGNGTANLDDASLMLGNWQAAGDTAAGTAAGAVLADGSIMLDMKGIALYKVFVGDDNHVQVSGTDFLSFDAGQTSQPLFGGTAEALQNNVNSETEDFGGFATDNILTSGDTLYGASTLKDTGVNADIAGIRAAGKYLWLEYQVAGGGAGFVAIPEPATTVLMALGGLGALIRRKK